MTLKSKDLGVIILLKNKWNSADMVCIETTIPLPNTSININFVTFAWLCHEDVDGISILLIIKPTRCTNFSNLFLE